MRAIIQNQYGGPEALQLVDLPAPEPAANEVVVAVRASSVTQGDRRLRSADYPGMTALFGRIAMGMFRPRHRTPGTNFAGRVVAVGASVTRFRVGDDVFGSAMGGAYAEQLAIPESGTIAAMPAGFAYEDAAALPYGGVTAIVFLQQLAKLQPGERVCILGAAGGVGRYAVQIAKHMGAHVTAVASARSEELVRSLGADAFIDYRSSDYRDAATAYDVVFDTVGASRFDLCRSTMSPTGRYMSLLMTIRLLAQMAWTTVAGGQRAMVTAAMGTSKDIEVLRDLAEAGGVRAVIDRTFPLEQSRDAHAYLESGAATGDVVVRVAGAGVPDSAVAA